MIQNIVQYLNLRLETLGRIADLHGISERRKRESDGANVPYCYAGSGEFKPVNIDNGNVGWWRPRGGFNMEPVEVIGRAVRQQRATYPLRFVAILSRELSVSDDAFMPSRLAEDIANALNFDNGDLRGILKAINVEARASGGEFDAATIWPTEFQTSIPDLRYELAMVAVDVTVEVVGRYSCWEGECATDTDILHLFNFCDPSVVARLTPAQVECLQLIAEDANWELFNTDGTLLDTGSIPSGDTDSIVAPDATVLINGTQFDTVASGDAIDLPVVNGGSNPVGAEQAGEWVIGNSAVFINGTQVGDVVAEDSLPLAVELDGNPSGTWNAGTQTWEVTSTPCADGTVNITNTDADPIATVTVASGGVEPYVIPNVAWTDSDGSSESTPYGEPIVCQAGAPSTSLVLSISDVNPFVGDIVTLTATPTNFTPTSYQFRIENGNDLELIVTQAGNVYNWTVPSLVGSFTVFVLATDGSSNLYESEPITIQSNYLLDVYPANNITDFATFKLNSAFVTRIMEVRRTVGAVTTAVEIGLDGDYITLNSPVLAVTTGSSSATTLGEFVAATAYANPDGITANQSAFVVRTYKQLNGALGGVQTTAVNQPRIVNAGVLDVENGIACLVFSGNQWLDFGQVNGGSKAANYSLLGVGRMLGGGTSMAFCSSLFSSANANDYLSIVNRNTRPNQYEVTFGETAAGLAYLGASTTAVINNTQQFFEQHKTSGVSGIDIHINGGAALAQTAIFNQTNNNSGAEGSLFLGRYGTFGSPLTGSAQMMVAYNANRTADRTGMKTLINSILGTSW